MCSTLSNDPEERPQMAFALLYEEAVVGILKNILMFLGMQLLKVQLFWIRFIFAFLNDLGPKSLRNVKIKYWTF